jgi:hypothetical protein
MTHRNPRLMDDRTRFEEFARLATEQRNPRTLDLDRLEIPGILDRIAAEDRTVPAAVAAEAPYIARAVELVVATFREGGRLIYVGAVTSGGPRLTPRVPPTFGSDPRWQVIAGGSRLVRAVRRRGSRGGRGGGTPMAPGHRDQDRRQPARRSWSQHWAARSRCAHSVRDARRAQGSRSTRRMICRWSAPRLMGSTRMCRHRPEAGAQRSRRRPSSAWARPTRT